MLAFEIRDFLQKAFFVCELAHTAQSALGKAEGCIYDFILLDLGLPDLDGLTLLSMLKKHNPASAYIILSARGNIEDRIKGLDLGADDYLPKPFSLPELYARMQAIIRRKFDIDNNTVSIGDFLVNLQKREVLYKETAIDFSRKEFDILSYLLLNRNRPLTRMQLSEHVWGNFMEDDNESNYIDAHIKNIRKKLNTYSTADWLETVRGVGYKIRKEV